MACQPNTGLRTSKYPFMQHHLLGGTESCKLLLLITRGLDMKSGIRALLIGALYCVLFAGFSLSANAAPPVATTNSIGINPSFEYVQACPRGYNFNARRGRCYPANRENYRGGGGGYYRGGYGGYACPPGYNAGANGCYPANRENFGGGGARWACPPGTNPAGGRCVWSGGVGCPPGYNAIAGQCYPNR